MKKILLLVLEYRIPIILCMASFIIGGILGMNHERDMQSTHELCRDTNEIINVTDRLIMSIDENYYLDVLTETDIYNNYLELKEEYRESHNKDYDTLLDKSRELVVCAEKMINMIADDGINLQYTEIGVFRMAIASYNYHWMSY